MKTSKLKDNAWKFSGRSNVYLLKVEKNILIDTGDERDREKLAKSLSEVIAPDRVDIVIFTHLHYDHIGNFSMFPNAKFYASEEEIDSFWNDREGTVLGPIAAKFNVELNELKDMYGLKVIHTPGHTVGSICLLYDGLLFSGDTVFDDCYGRIDLPTSAPDKMDESIALVGELKYDILCPGHDY
jgi:glyoxylase-like metal-dependent hydrolase (beta-lactamase superfamily II)